MTLILVRLASQLTYSAITLPIAAFSPSPFPCSHSYLEFLVSKRVRVMILRFAEGSSDCGQNGSDARDDRVQDGVKKVGVEQ